MKADGLTNLMVFTRVLPIGLALAQFSRGLVPQAVALSLTLALTVALVPLAGDPPHSAQIGALLPALLRELCIGGVFALALSLSLLTIAWALRMSQAPGSGGPVDALSRAYAACAAWLVLSLGGLRAIVIGLAESFHDAPLAGVQLELRTFALGIAQLLADAFASALGFAVPLLLSVWLLELGAGSLSRVLMPGSLATVASLRPLIFLLAAAVLLMPIASHAPEGVRAAIASARLLTRAFAR